MDLPENHDYTLPEILHRGTPIQRTDYALAMALHEWVIHENKSVDYGVAIFQDILLYNYKAHSVFMQEDEIRELGYDAYAWVSSNTSFFDRAFARFIRVHTKIIHPERRYADWAWGDIANRFEKHIISTASDYAEKANRINESPLNPREKAMYMNGLDNEYKIYFSGTRIEGLSTLRDLTYLFYTLKDPMEDEKTLDELLGEIHTVNHRSAQRLTVGRSSATAMMALTTYDYLSLFYQRRDAYYAVYDGIGPSLGEY